MSKIRSTLLLLVLGTTMAACGSDPADPPKTTTPPGDKLSAILSTPGPAKECFDEIPPPTVDQQATADNPCPDSGSACGNIFPVRWCKADGAPAISMCEKGAWVLKAKKCP